MRVEATVIVPTFNEAPNVAELVRRIDEALDAQDAEILFVDDSTDDTPDVVRAVAASTRTPVRLIHRTACDGGLGGAVLAGLAAARSDVCIVMDGDLQHPPELIPRLIQRFRHGDADLVVASRYTADGSAHGLSGAVRVGVSRGATVATKAMFPLRLRGCSDPMTGFFLVDRRAIELEGLRPRGFKILLEILARNSVRVREVPFQFGQRLAGASKASMSQGISFLTQLMFLRFGKMSGFALIGALGAVLNLMIMAGLTATGLDYVLAAVVAAEVTIVGNFLMIERWVFGDMIEAASDVRSRFAKSFSFNNAEALVRIPVLYAVVEAWHVSSLLAAGATLLVAFVVRFGFHSLVVYAPRARPASQPTSSLVPVVDGLAAED
jgi:dolichol-phosphate mannosyltransferase